MQSRNNVKYNKYDITVLCGTTDRRYQNYTSLVLSTFGSYIMWNMGYANISNI